MKRLILVALLLLPATAAQPVEPDEMLANPALEDRARELSKELRCLVCQNQSIDDSNAPLARDLRILVRERLTAGDSDEAVLDFVVARYGEFVLLRPPFRAATWLLWLAPPALLVMAVIFALLYIRRRPKTTAAAPLSEAERARLEALMRDERQ